MEVVFLVIVALSIGCVRLIAALVEVTESTAVKERKYMAAIAIDCIVMLARSRCRS